MSRLSWVLVFAVAAGCAPVQRIPLEVVPADASLFVDGREVPGSPEAIELRSDRDHTLYFKSPGYRPELRVLESRTDAGEARLEPDAVRVRLRSLRPERREVRIEPDQAPAAPLD